MEFDAEFDSSDCETSAVFVVLAADLPFIKLYILSSMVERIAKVQISFTLPVKNDERGELSAFFVGGLSILRCRIFHRFIITFDEKNVKIP